MAKTQPEDIGKGLDTGQFLTFILSGEEFAISIMRVKEIIEYRDLTNVPMVPSFISGAINLRGSIVPVINLAIKFAMPPADITRRTCVVIMEVAMEGMSTVMGVLVDKVLQVLDIPEGDIEPAPALGTKIRTDFIYGMGKLDDHFVVILDVDHVLSAQEVTVVGQLQADKDASVLQADVSTERDIENASV